MEPRIKRTVAFELDGKLYPSEGAALRALRDKQEGKLRTSIMALHGIIGRSGDFDVERAADLENCLRSVGYDLSVMFELLGFPKEG